MARNTGQQPRSQESLGCLMARNTGQQPRSQGSLVVFNPMHYLRIVYGILRWQGVVGFLGGDRWTS